MTKIARLLLLSAMITLSGCKTDLYTGLSEIEANEMLSILIDHGIQSEKFLNKDGLHNIQVDEQDLSESVQLLKRMGYPKQKFKSMGEIFVKDGMISSPQEESARLNFALSQELSSTISLIDGVVSARVHVVLPEKDSYGNESVKAAASVFIKHTDKLMVENVVPKVKSLVSNSVEKLEYDQVSVSLFDAQKRFVTDQPTVAHIGFLRMNEDSVGSFIVILSLLVLLILAPVGALGYIVYQQRKAPNDTEGEAA